MRRRKSRQALEAWAAKPRRDLAAAVGQDGRGLDHVQRMLRQTLREEADPVRALRQTQDHLAHLRQDRALMAQALLAARAEVRHHQPVEFEPSLLSWCDE